MTIEQIQQEFDRHGKLSPRAVSEVMSLLGTEDPYAAITLAADAACFELAPYLARCLSSHDPMVRWNAAATLFTRFRSKEYAAECLKLARCDNDEIVKSVSLVGLGELLPLIDDEKLRKKAANELLMVLENGNNYPEIRSSAYEGVLAAIGIAPLDRPPANKSMNLKEDLIGKHVETFCQKYGVSKDCCP